MKKSSEVNIGLITRSRDGKHMPPSAVLSHLLCRTDFLNYLAATKPRSRQPTPSELRFFSSIILISSEIIQFSGILTLLIIQGSKPNSKNNWGHILYGQLLCTPPGHMGRLTHMDHINGLFCPLTSSGFSRKPGGQEPMRPGYYFPGSHPAQWLWVSLLPLLKSSAPVTWPPPYLSLWFWYLFPPFTPPCSYLSRMCPLLLH